MGLFGAIGNLIKKGAKKVVEKAKEVKDWLVEKGKKVWNKFTGKEKFDQADALYNKIKEKYNSRRKRFEQEVEEYTSSIENYVNAINGYKEKIKKELFPQMAKHLKRFSDVRISDKFAFEEFEIKEYSFDDLRKTEELYKIDFNKHPIKSNALAILTLGFYTRKKATETYFAVEEEERKINREIGKMNIEAKRLETINAALANIDTYFNDLIGIYESLLTRVESSANFLFVKCMTFAHKIIMQEMSIRKLPKAQINEFNALDIATKTLKTMVDTPIVSLSDEKEVSKYEEGMHKEYDKMYNAYKAA